MAETTTTGERKRAKQFERALKDIERAHMAEAVTLREIATKALDRQKVKRRAR